MLSSFAHMPDLDSRYMLLKPWYPILHELNLIFLVKAACTTILDEIRGSYAAFRVTSKYSGPTVRIRRSNDGSTADFYANKQGSLGTSLDGGGTSISQWLGGSQGYVVIWYDQSGQGRHATQSTSSSQPYFDHLNNLKPNLYEPSNRLISRTHCFHLPR